MSSRLSPVLLVVLCLLSASTIVRAQNGHGGPTRLLRTPTVSSTQIGFAYANNIWVAATSRRQRATSDQLSGTDSESTFLT